MDQILLQKKQKSTTHAGETTSEMSLALKTPPVENNLRNQCYDDLVKYINHSIIDLNEPEYASDLLERFQKSFEDRGGNAKQLEKYTTQNLSKRLRSSFNDNVLSIQRTPSNALVLFKTSSSKESAAVKAEEKRKKQTAGLESAARHLREIILKQKPLTLTEPVTVDAIMKGEVEPPEQLKHFFRHLYSGQGDPKKVSESKQRYIESSSADAVFACSGGRLLPGKHLSLALAVKSLTGSKQVVTLMNRYGHSASNETSRRLDMELEQTCKIKSGDIVPYGLIKVKGLSTGTA